MQQLKSKSQLFRLSAFEKGLLHNKMSFNTFFLYGDTQDSRELVLFDCLSQSANRKFAKSGFILEPEERMFYMDVKKHKR